MNILWDFDGTLFDTYPGYARMVKNAVQTNLSEEEIFSLLKVSFGHASQELNLTDEQIKHIHLLERQLKPLDFKPFPGLKEVLESADLNVIMTHKYREGAESILKANGMDQYFTEIVATDDGFPRKPHPASYQYLHDKYRIDLAVGDRELDILPAKSIGIKACLFQNDTPVADYYVDSYYRFFDIVK